MPCSLEHQSNSIELGKAWQKMFANHTWHLLVQRFKKSTFEVWTIVMDA
jgi:hypothetical protein